MTIRWEDYLATLPQERQDAIAKRAAELIEEEASLRQIREARERTQAAVAERLHIKQAAVSKLERRTDMYLSTLRGYIEAMGGSLEIIARFPDQTVRLTQFSALDPETAAGVVDETADERASEAISPREIPRTRRRARSRGK